MQGDRRMPALLVVDDEPSISRIITIVASGLGRQAVAVPDAESALEILPEVRPQMMLVDVRLPGIDGVELVRRIKTDVELASTPILLMSAYGEPPRHDGDGFLAKPFDVDQLSDLIERYTTSST